MSGINTTRVLVGGLVAGLVLNVGHGISEWLMASEMESMIQRLGLAAPGGGTMTTLALMGFAVGIIGVWLYASMAPRYGLGATTGLLAGGVIWVLLCLIPNVTFHAFGIVTAAHFWMASLADLVIVPSAVWAGSRLYSEATVRELGTAAAVIGR